MNNVTVVRSGTHVKIYIDQSLHLAFNLFRIRVHSWHDGFGVNERFFIDIKSAGDVIECEYDNKAMWLAILAELDKVIT